MKRIFGILFLFTLLGLAVPAGAQSDLTVDFLQVQLWPEYDRPSMLVIYTLELSAEQSLPVEVSVRIPASVGEPTAVAVLENTTLVTREYTLSVDGDWAEITLQADFPVIQIEYYDTALSQQDQPRTYDFRWVSDFSVGSMMVRVKQPVNANGMTIQPNLGAGFADSDGTTVFASSIGPWAAGQSFDLSLSYNKNDTALTFQSPIQSVPESSSQPIAPLLNQLPVWVWALIGAGLLVLVGGGVLFFRSNRSNLSNSSYQRKKKRAVSRSASSSGARRKTGVFCHQCGTRAFANDKFCRECGTKLRL